MRITPLAPACELEPSIDSPNTFPKIRGLTREVSKCAVGRNLHEMKSQSCPKVSSAIAELDICVAQLAF